MAFIKGHEFIIAKKTGEIFNFYLNEEKYIEYILSDHKGRWKEKHIVLEQQTEGFHMEVDDYDHIHILSYHTNGDLFYHIHNGRVFSNHLITHYPVSEQKILYPIIKSIHNKIHLFYYLIHAREKNKAYLLHLSFNDKKYTANHIATLSTHSYVNPFKVLVADEQIFLLYGSVMDGKDQIFICRYDISKATWENPIQLTSTKDNKIYLDGLLDHHKNIHIIWSRYDDEHLTVEYLKLPLEQLTSSLEDLKTIELSSKSSGSFPVLIYYKKILWAVWTEINKVVSSYSIDGGNSWSKPYVDERTRNIDYKRYRYISNSIESKDPVLCDYVYGTLYPNIQFLGFGGGKNDAISSE